MSIRELREAVEAGDMNETVTQARKVFHNLSVRRDVLKSCDGSLDAAKALHDAVLPGRSWTLEDHGGFVADIWLGVSGDDDFHLASGRSDNPARAWLIAILRALESQEDA